MEKKRNLWVIPTDKPTRLVKQKYDTIDRLCLADMATKKAEYKRFNLYITSDEEIKEGDYGLSKLNEVILFGKSYNEKLYKKIILTTDQDLIKDGVQSIDDEFFEWFIKNQSCEEIEVILLRKSSGYYDEKDIWHWDFLGYKIIIPSEEPKQGTMSEAIKQVIDKQLKQDRTCTNNCSNVCGECQIFEPKQEILLEDIFNNEKREGVKALIDMMKGDEELGLYNEPFKHEFKVLTKEEVMEGRSSAYEFIDFDKQETLEEIFNIIDDKKCRYSSEESEFWHHYKIGVLDGLKEQQERSYSDMRESFLQGWRIKERFEDLSPDIIYPNGLDYEEKQDYAFDLWFEKFKKK